MRKIASNGAGCPTYRILDARGRPTTLSTESNTIVLTEVANSPNGRTQRSIRLMARHAGVLKSHGQTTNKPPSWSWPVEQSS